MSDLKSTLQALGRKIHVVGFIATEDKPSVAYANATKRVFHEAGFNYELRQVQRLQLEREIIAANEDPDVHGIFIYFPVFANQEDDYLRNLVHYSKDIEAGSLYWTRKLSANDRMATEEGGGKKALIPCTPLAIVKILDDIGEYGNGNRPISGKTLTIFNRSEVIGRPLAVMMSNDGANVYSFDENGPLRFVNGQPEETSIDRAQALAQSNMVITGVPNKAFHVNADEISEHAVCVNFSSEKNFAGAVSEKARVFVPRVGPMTVAMCMRNTIRLFGNFHQ
ncbi:MAG: hypothetical protein JJ952_17785 [Pseudomonadales bacterium]|nr:hypothetical protein [Pseudomonadales bacterium]MBO6823932.1 hypothetical protein [Pseudomonadales bacterium]